jgi:predicted N-acyltransferase
MPKATTMAFPQAGLGPVELNGHACLRAPAPSAVSSAVEQHVTVRPLASIAEVPRTQWNQLFPGAAEGWDYFRACELAEPKGFSSSAIAAFAGETMIAAAPLFRLNYRLDMSLEGPLRPVGNWLNRHVPKLVNAPILGMGSPLTEECPIGLLPRMSPADRITAFAALLAGMSDHAKAAGISILALKDVSDGDALWAHDTLVRSGFTRVATLPVATLHLPFKDEQDYLASLSAATRKDIKRKMKSLSGVEVEVRDTIKGIEDEIVLLFEETKAKRKADYDAFDDVPPAYFREVVSNLGGKAKIMLTRVGGELASFNIFFEERDRIVDKYIGMRYPLAREHNIYFITWMMMVRRCIEKRVSWLQMGHTTYCQKVRMGCKLKRSWVYFKHRNPVINALFKAAGPRMAFDRMDPDLAELGTEAPYLAPGTSGAT